MPNLPSLSPLTFICNGIAIRTTYGSTQYATNDATK